MGLAIVVFVPEGVVVASDGLAEIRNQDQDQVFLQRRQKNLFPAYDKYLICAQGNGYINGLPYAYYVHKALYSLHGEYKSTKSFAEAFANHFLQYISKEERISFYIIGNDEGACGMESKVFLVEGCDISPINVGRDGQTVYNYHSMGRSLWVNKMLLPTAFSDEQNHIEFETVDIDFSKYSLSDALCFSKTLLSISNKMDQFAQIKQMVGENVSIAALTISNKIILKDCYE